MSNVVSFADLKRKAIRKVIPFGDSEVVIKNPTPEQKQEIFDMLIRNFDVEKREMSISDRDVLVVLMPMLTNIAIDLDDEELISDVLADPSEVFLDVKEELSGITVEITGRFEKVLNRISMLSDEEVAKILGENPAKTVVGMVEAEDAKVNA